jgi:acyl-CoA thioesterase I
LLMILRSIFFATIILLICSAPAAAIDENIANRDSLLADLCDQLELVWPENHTVTIVCHGHSVPAGYFKTPFVDTFNAYPHLLHMALKQRFPHAVINVIVTAIGGESSDNGAKRFERDVLSLRPDLITIDYALNDRGIGLEQAKTAWTKMIKMAQDKNIPLMLLTPTADTRSDILNSKDPLSLHAQQIRDLAAKFNTGLVGSYAAFQAWVLQGNELDDLMSQINHPNRRGHDVVVAELLKWFPD